MDHRRETRVVIGGDLADLALLLCFRVHAGITAADEPENRWGAPRSSKGSEVLAGARRLGFLHTFSGKVPPKRVAYSLDCIRIILNKSVTIKGGDLRLLSGP